MSYNPYQQTPQESSTPSVNSRRMATEKVKMPSILLIVSGLISLVTNVGAGGMSAGIYLGMKDQVIAEMQKQPQDPELTPEVMELTCNIFGWGGVAFAVLGLIGGMFVIAGGASMMKLKAWGFALMAAIVSMVPCLQGCCLLSLPVGIYAMVVLFDAQVKNAFD